MIRPLTLGNTSFPVNIIQGPLAGVSCAPFRRLVWQYGKPAFSCTEMLSCKTLIHQSGFSQRRFVAIDPAEGPVCFQLSGTDPKELAEATKIVTANGANLIDLNCGCPVKKIRSRGAGSSLLTNASQLYQLITAMKQNTHLPVSIKIRVDANSGDKFNQEIARVVSEAGADFLVVHGRHWTQHYETACQYDEIKFFVEELTIPVIGNGDIACVASLQKMFATQCAGVMLGRAGVGQPWLIQELIAGMRQEAFKAPAMTEVGNMFIGHVVDLARLLENEKFAILQARKFAKYYARRLNTASEFCDAVNQCESLQALSQAVENHFSRLG
ncbi:MAG: tRNA-dihydrouridine synthase [Pseudomonadota bacterium]